METRDPPSLLNKVMGPPIFLFSGLAALLWFFYRSAFLFQNISEPLILFDKGSYYMLGVGLGLLTLGVVVVIEFWGGKPITAKQNVIFTRLAMSAMVLLFVVPHGVHVLVDRYLTQQGYSVCEEASHQWLFVRDIVYVDKNTQCSSKLVSK